MTQGDIPIEMVLFGRVSTTERTSWQNKNEMSLIVQQANNITKQIDLAMSLPSLFGYLMCM